MERKKNKWGENLLFCLFADDTDRGLVIVTGYECSNAALFVVFLAGNAQKTRTKCTGLLLLFYFPLGQVKDNIAAVIAAIKTSTTTTTTTAAAAAFVNRAEFQNSEN